MKFKDVRSRMAVWLVVATLLLYLAGLVASLVMAVSWLLN